jgi:prepilin-type N-terminal cleavage/methylation domain-containing protein
MDIRNLLSSKKNISYSSRGFTLIEVVIVLSIIAIVGEIFFTFQRDVISHNSMIQSGAVAEDSMRAVLRQFVGEIRSAGQAVNGAYLLDSVATSTIIFYSDIDSDGQTEKVRYFLEGTDFKKGVTEPTGSPLVYLSSEEKIRTVAKSVINGSADVFSYFDENYPVNTDPLDQPVDVAKVRLVKINLGFDPNPSRPLQPMWISSMIMIRNLKNSF